MFNNLTIGFLKEKINNLKINININEKKINNLNESYELNKDTIFYLLKTHNININILSNLENLSLNLKEFNNKEFLFASSNKSKLNEIQRIVPTINSIDNAIDLDEVDGSIDDVIIYKAKDARIQNKIKENQIIIVEDTIIRDLTNNRDLTDIKWNLDALEEGMQVQWITSLAINDNDNIYVFRGVQDGIITKERIIDGFAFDPFFVPIELYSKENIEKIINNSNCNNYTLAELEQKGLKDDFSARAKALNNLSNFNFENIIKIDSILEWNGRYQNDKDLEIEIDM